MKDNWISVKADLKPKNEQIVLGYQENEFKDFQIVPVWYCKMADKYRGWFEDYGHPEAGERDYDSEYPKVTHWQPLPKPPQS